MNLITVIIKHVLSYTLEITTLSLLLIIVFSVKVYFSWKREYRHNDSAQLEKELSLFKDAGKQWEMILYCINILIYSIFLLFSSNNPNDLIALILSNDIFFAILLTSTKNSRQFVEKHLQAKWIFLVIGLIASSCAFLTVLLTNLLNWLLSFTPLIIKPVLSLFYQLMLAFFISLPVFYASLLFNLLIICFIQKNHKDLIDTMFH